MPRSAAPLRGLILAGVIIAVLSGCDTGPGNGEPANSSPASSTASSAAAGGPAGSSPAGSMAGGSPRARESRVCVSAEAFAGALQGFKDTLRPGVRSQEIRAARDQVVTAYDDLVDAAADLAQDRVRAVESATARFRAAVDALPEDATPTEAIDSLRAEADDVRTALRGLTSELDC